MLCTYTSYCFADWLRSLSCFNDGKKTRFKCVDFVSVYSANWFFCSLGGELDGFH